MTGRESTIDAFGIRWGALEWGTDGDPLIVALHGWLDNAASFSGIAPILASKGFRVLSIDFPGHGKTVSDGQPLGGASRHSYRAPMQFVDYIPPLHALLNAVSPRESVRILGHSMGAGLALLYAGAFPERVSKLALIEGLGPITSPESDSPLRLRKHTEAFLALRSKRPPEYSNLDDLIAKRAEAGGLSKESARVLIERAMERGREGWIWRTDPLHRLPSPYRMTESQVHPFLDRISCPVLLFMAERGIPHDLEQAKNRIARIRDVHLERVPGGHHVHLDDPGAIAERLLRFIS